MTLEAVTAVAKEGLTVASIREDTAAVSMAAKVEAGMVASEKVVLNGMEVKVDLVEDLEEVGKSNGKNGDKGKMEINGGGKIWRRMTIQGV